MNYSAIKNCDIANGPGVRVSLFVSGCTHHCRGCFNQVTWPFESGEPFTQEVEDRIIQLAAPAYVGGLSLLGGEPCENENLPAVIRLCERFRRLYPDKTIWCYSGYTFEQLTGLAPCRTDTALAMRLLRLTDVLVDGEFILARKDITLRFRGSDNQRVIDVPRSLPRLTPVLWEDDPMLRHGH